MKWSKLREQDKVDLILTAVFFGFFVGVPILYALWQVVVSFILGLLY